MDSSRIQQLSWQYLDGSLLPEEWEELQQLLATEAGQAVFAATLENAGDNWTYPKADPLKLERLLRKTFDPENQNEGRIVPLWKRWWVAASVILLLAITTYLWIPAGSKTDPTRKVVTNGDIQPGTNGAVLTLADGRQIVLDSLGSGVIAKQQGAEIKLQHGQIMYDEAESKPESVTYNIMRTPKGRQFQLTLSDGTRIWLNAESSVRYPAVFTAKERTVEVEGEAYFEVVKNAASPFFVKINETTNVEVLGTDFNVNAYTNEQTIDITLLNGKVKVNAAAEAAVLTPGKQARVTAMNINSGDADIEKVIAWKNGLFDFRDVSFATIMRQLERWYDIEVVYENKVPDLALMGKISRDVSLQGLLKNLQRMGVQSRLEGRKLIIQ